MLKTAYIKPEPTHQKYYPVLSNNVLLIGRIWLDLLFKFANFRCTLNLPPFRESYFNNTFTTNTTVEPFQGTTTRGSGLIKESITTARGGGLIYLPWKVRCWVWWFFDVLVRLHVVFIAFLLHRNRGSWSHYNQHYSRQHPWNSKWRT